MPTELFKFISLIGFVLLLVTLVLFLPLLGSKGIWILVICVASFLLFHTYRKG